MGTILTYYCRALNVLTVGLLAAMVALIFGNVVLRYAFNSGITVSEELSRWLFVWLTFLGGVCALRDGQHLGTDVLLSRLSPAVRRVSLLIGYALMLWICWLLFNGALTQTRLNWNVSAPSSGAPVAWFYASGLVFSVSAAAVLLEQILLTLTGRGGRGLTSEEAS